jgi:hypothetical protein
MAARFGPLVGGAAAVDNGTGTSGYAFFMSVFTAARLACASSVRTLLAVILLALMATMVAVPLTTACDLETRPHEWTAHADVPALKVGTRPCPVRASNRLRTRGWNVSPPTGRGRI